MTRQTHTGELRMIFCIEDIIFLVEAWIGLEEMVEYISGISVAPHCGEARLRHAAPPKSVEQ